MGHDLRTWLLVTIGSGVVACSGGSPDRCHLEGRCDPARERCLDPGVPTGTCLGSAGGLLRIPGGAELSVPAGALAGQTALSVAAVAPERVDAVLLAHAGSLRLRTLFAFELGPSGLVPALPLTLRVPVPRLGPGERLIHVTVEPAAGTARLEPTSLRLDGAAGFVELRLAHFSTAAAAVFTTQTDVCRDPATYALHVEECANPYQQPCCSWADAFRGPDCLPGHPLWAERCCMEVIAEVRSSGQELSRSACEVVSQALEITFPACHHPPPGGPEPYVWRDAQTGIASACGELDWTVAIEPPSPAPICTALPLSVSLTGRSADQTIAIGPTKVAATWALAPPDAGEVSLSSAGASTSRDLAYRLRGRRTGALELTATVSIDATRSVSARRQLELTCRMCGPITFASGALPVSELTVVRGFDAPLAARLLDDQARPADPGWFGWSVADPAIARLAGEPATGTPDAMVRGVAFGSTTATARWDDGCEALTASIPVRVVGVELAPAAATLSSGQTVRLQATSTIPDYPCEVRWLWVSPDVRVAPDGPDAVLVTAGPLAGTAHVTAICGEYQEAATITITCHDGLACDDGDPCTIEDRCAQGRCAGMAKPFPAPGACELRCHLCGPAPVPGAPFDPACVAECGW